MAAVYALGGLAAVGVYFLLPSAAAQVGLESAVDASALAAMAVGIRRHRPEQQLAWLAFLGGVGLLVAGDAVSNGYGLAGTSLSSPSVVDGVYLGAYPLLALGAVLLVPRSRSLTQAVLLDTSIFAVAAAGAMWDLLSGPARTGSTAARIVLTSYPAADLLIGVVFALLIVAGAWVLPATGTLLAALVLLTAGGIVYTHAPGYSSGKGSDALWLLSYVLWGATALDPSMVRLGRIGGHQAGQIASVRFGVLSVPVLVAAGFVVNRGLSRSLQEPEIVLASVLVLLLLLRVATLLRSVEAWRAVEEKARVRLQQTNERLAESEARFRALTESSFDLVSIIDAEGTVTYQNPAIERTLGFRPEETLGTNALELVHPDDLGVVAETIATGIGTAGATERLEYRARRKDGSWRRLEAIGQNLLDTPGVEGILVTSRDITERRQAEEALRASEERFRNVFEFAPNGIALTDATGRFVAVNPALAEMLGYPGDGLLAMTFRDLADPADAESDEQLFRRIAEERTPSGVIDRRQRRNDGSWIWCEISISPIFDGDTLTGGVVQYLDITALHAATARLRESEARFRTSFQHAPTAMIVVDTDGRLTTVNPEFSRITGYTETDALQMTLGDLVAPGAPGSDMAVLKDLFAGGEMRDLERHLLAKDGTGRWMLFNGSVVVGDDISYALIQGLDITARHTWETEQQHLLVAERAARQELASVERQLAEQNERLREADRLKDELISVVSHDLRTPLTSIVGYIELLDGEEAGELNDDQRRFVETISRNAQHLLRLVEDLLFVSRAESGRVVLELADVDLVEVVRHSFDTARLVADANGVELVLDAPAPAPLRGDALRLGDMVDNLISNAVKFTPAGGRVRASVVTRGDHVLLEVSDTGMGIAAADQRRLFERFFRAGEALSMPGAGLGLSIVKAIVESHGGAVSVESEHGVGTTFSVELPISVPQPAEVAEVTT